MQVARHQSSVATMVKAVTPVLPTSIIEGFSKWAILNPVRQKAVELYERIMMQFKTPVVEMVLGLANQGDTIDANQEKVKVDMVYLQDMELRLKRLTEYAADPGLEQRRVDFVLAL